MDLSIIIPTIRTPNWPFLLDSIEGACTRSHEIILVGPYYDNCIQNKRHIKYVRDFGSPNRCQQIGMLLAEGDVITWGSDDCMYRPGSIDKCLDTLGEQNAVLVTNYDEGGACAVDNFSLNHCYAKCESVKDEWVIFNAAFMPRLLFESIGGFDCEFDVTCVGHADLAARCQAAGYKVIVSEINLLDCSHMPGTSGDHAPIHYAQIQKDIPAYSQKFNSSEFPKINIDINNWKNQPSQWRDRFNGP